MNTTTKTKTKFHLSLHAADLARSEAFYRDLLGVAPSKSHDDYVRFTTDDPPLVLSLVRQTHGSMDGPQQLSHLGFRVDSPEDLAAARARLKSAGRTVRDEEQSHCCYAVQNKFWAVDPDGVEWEFYHLLRDLDSMGKDSSDCCE